MINYQLILVYLYKLLYNIKGLKDNIKHNKVVSKGRQDLRGRSHLSYR
jgi:hypothetical protein